MLDSEWALTVNSHEYRIYCIDNVGLARTMEYLSPPIYFMQMIFFVLRPGVFDESYVITVSSFVTLQGIVCTHVR